MLKQSLLEGTGTSRRDFCIAFALLFNAFTWFYMTLVIIANLPLSLNFISTFRTIFYITTIGSSIAGSLFSEKIGRLHFLYVWMILGIVSSFFLIFSSYLFVGYFFIVFLLLGISFGLGMPSSLSFLADHTSIENRGRVSSLIFLAANLSALPLAILLITFNLATSAAILTVWRGIGLVLFIMLKPREPKPEKMKKSAAFTTIFHDKSFVLYLLPWLLFSLIDILEKSVLENFSKNFPGPGFGQLIATAEPIIASFSILVGGLLSDRIGRKRVVIYGFISLGIAYAIIGIAPLLLISWYLYLIIDGLAAGILWIVFILILWGDLSQTGAREKYYAIGSSPFFARSIIPLFLMPVIEFVPATAAFSLASFFLFLAVLPLMYAPETLPEKKMEIRRLKGYVEQAKKFTEKYTKKK
jgi:MFS family permease